MGLLLRLIGSDPRLARNSRASEWAARGSLVIIAACVAGCASRSRIPVLDGPSVPVSPATLPAAAPIKSVPSPFVRPAAPGSGGIENAKSRWVAVSFADLPGFAADNWHDAWGAWAQSCARPLPSHATICPELRRLSWANDAERRAWVMGRFDVYRVASKSGVGDDGLLTGYFEPELAASRLPSAEFSVPIYGVPSDLARRKPWFTREELDTLAVPKAALRGKELMHVRDVVDAMVLSVQGSGRVSVLEPDGTRRAVRLAFAGSNDQPFKSVGRWLLDRGLVRDASWAGVRAWANANPAKAQEMSWSNPRVVFFKEDTPSAAVASMDLGPRGAQGVPLTQGRSLAVDRASIPLGTPVWMSTQSAVFTTQRLVFAQDTGGAISGAVRADFFAGSGDAAGQLAARIKQPLALWVLWPKGVPLPN